MSTIKSETEIDGWRVVVSGNGVPHVLFVPPASDRFPGWTRIASTGCPLGSVKPGCVPVAHGVPDTVERRGMQMLLDVEDR
jgi:hypothetical protein